MDPARPTGADATWRGGGILKRLALGLCLAAGACSQLSPDFGTAVAITIKGPVTPQVEEGDTLTLTAQALDINGAILTDQTVFWTITDPVKRVDTVNGQPVNVPRGFTIDSITGLITAFVPDTAKILAYDGTLRSNTLQVIITPQPDTVFAPITRIVVAPLATESGALAVTVQDITTNPATPRVLGGKTVSYVITSPAAVTSIYLEAHTTPGDSLPGADPLRGSVKTAGNGQALIFVHTVAGQTPPDSAVVEATGLTARGATVKGSPVRFTVVFAVN